MPSKVCLKTEREVINGSSYTNYNINDFFLKARLNYIIKEAKLLYH